MTPQAMRAAQLPAELQIHETAEYRVNAPQSIAKLWLSSVALVGGPSARLEIQGLSFGGVEGSAKESKFQRFRTGCSKTKPI